jgi:hypothetical protein
MTAISSHELYGTLKFLKGRARSQRSDKFVRELAATAHAWIKAVEREQSDYLAFLRQKMSALNYDRARGLVSRFPYSDHPEIRAERLVLMQHEALRLEIMRTEKRIERARQLVAAYLRPHEGRDPESSRLAS